MPMANGTQHSRGRLELFEASTQNDRWRHCDEVSGSGTPRTVSVRRSVLMGRWLHVPEAEDRQDAFWRFFVALMPRVESPHHGKERMSATLSADLVDDEEPRHLHRTTAEIAKLSIQSSKRCSWTTRRGCAAVSLEYRKPAPVRRPVWCGYSIWFPVVNWNNCGSSLIVLCVLS